ncbi:tetratricopeptide (TPR) repeat protein [Ancylobacter sp. 3268]|uniref:tetratricopeptide repeat protein n=1 Tax=Ancylobacter sp. 3268 TaxID=2817752 RepID=UPI002861775B|nr:tetratricopeptide repeat protein [Ancylobacter sp. 3268]MDR6952202.1 tetratricopeptide (TPR) repeat protein [Ancylobacter sp. 3268]
MRAFFAVLFLTVSPLAALAQTAPPAETPPAAKAEPAPQAADPQAASPQADSPQSKSPDAAGAGEPDRAKRLDALFAALKVAPTPESAKSIADRIDIALTPSGSETVDLLMSRAAIATQAKDYDLALQLLDGILVIDPNHLDAWNRRATVFYLQQDYADALADLRQVIAREPRHYAAWMGIALIAKDLGDEKHALEAVRKARDIYPQFEQAENMEETLSLSVEGRPI